MKINRQSLVTNKAIVIPITVLILCSLIVALAYHYQIGPFNSHKDGSIDLNKPTDPQIKQGVNIKQQSVNQSTDSTKTQVGSDPAPTPQQIGGSNKSSVGVEITAATQDRTTFHVRALIQTVTQSGKCDLVMTGPKGEQYTATAATQAMSTSSTCKGFDIPLTALSSGNWKAVITFNNDTLTGSASKDITVQ